MPVEAVTFPFYFTWRNNPVRETLYGKKCRIVATGRMNSVSLEFESGEQVVTSRYSLRTVDSGWKPLAARPRDLVHCAYCGARRRRSQGRLGFVFCEACQDKHPVCLDGCTLVFGSFGKQAPLVCRGVSPNVKVVLKRCPSER